MTSLHSGPSTGSTTAALIYLLHYLTHSLKNHKSVHLIALDFSNAFDTLHPCNNDSQLSYK